MLTPYEASLYMNDTQHERHENEVYTDHCPHCDKDTKQDGIEGHNGWDSYFYTVCQECKNKIE